MADVFICPTGAIKAATRRALQSAGVVVVEAAEPDRCRFIKATAPVDGDDMLWAALKALQVRPKFSDHGTAQREAFVDLLSNLMTAAREDQKKPVLASDVQEKK